MVKLSICIATYNRADFIGETLESIIEQIDPEVEIIVFDGASVDGTAEIVSSYTSSCGQIKYYREEFNSGIDQGYDKAVAYSTGEYCWLMSDDDLLELGAVDRVLSELSSTRDLIVVNASVRSADLTKTIAPRQLNLRDDKTYESNFSAEFVAECMSYLSFIGCVVIRRNEWLRSDRKSYYGTLFIHIGVIFQERVLSNIYIISEPLIIIRYGNAMWTSRGFEIWMFKWPQLVWSFINIPDDAKSLVCEREPFKRAKELILKRAVGGYGISEFRKYLFDRVFGVNRAIAIAIAYAPASLVNALASLYCIAFNRRALSGIYDFSRCANSTAISRMVARVMNL